MATTGNCFCHFAVFIIISTRVAYSTTENATSSISSNEGSRTEEPTVFPVTVETIAVTEHSMIHINETIIESLRELDETGRIAGITIGVLGGLAIALTLIGFFVYKQYLRRNVTSMNFDNPVYRKTTEDQFSLEKNQYQPARSYPPSLEPLTSPGTNEFV